MPLRLTTLTSLIGKVRLFSLMADIKKIRSVIESALLVLGVDHPDTLSNVSNLAVVLQNQGKYEQAEAINRRALAGRKKVLGMNIPDTLTSVSTIASVLQE